ncbi:MAG: NAD+ synthase [Microbacteriaceae bacterium]|jgi:NAD+ synthase (glutamine-hydrolysing)|nr:NAD+ synthase [Microbacteriaceae bacterium]MCI1207653.1 NAD+ synthase [Microbacteriaceae bacterium]
MTAFRVCLAQINPILGDFSGNTKMIADAVQESARNGAQLIAFPEMALTGYPIEDLATDPDFLATTRRELEGLASRLETAGLGDRIVVVGFPAGPFPADRRPPASPTAIAENRAAVLQHGRVVGEYTKHHLPNYAVFDEFRNFVPGDDPVVLQAGPLSVGLMICEDLWRPAGPLDHLSGCDLVLVINASPYATGKVQDRLELIRSRVHEVGAPIAYVNLVGGQDDLVFDGASMFVDATGEVQSRASSFQTELLFVDVPTGQQASDRHPAARVVTVDLPAAPATPCDRRMAPSPSPLEETWMALVTGLRDYVKKNGFPGVVLGLSGGIDSSLVASLAVDALGPDRVWGVLMPSRYSSDHSLDDAHDLVTRLGIHSRTEPITDLVPPFEHQLHLDGVAAENLQARLRGVILMAISNSEGQLVLTTGNKSELAVGYSTIYGDAVGGFNPIKDVVKTLVWDLCRWRNARATETGQTPPIPEHVIVKPPSAELRPDQTDQDSLPPYTELDDIIHRYVELREGPDDIIAAGHSLKTVSRIIALIDRAEWKRRQAAPGTRITELAFGRDRRIPITNRRPHAR